MRHSTRRNRRLLSVLQELLVHLLRLRRNCRISGRQRGHFRIICQWAGKLHSGVLCRLLCRFPSVLYWCPGPGLHLALFSARCRAKALWNPRRCDQRFLLQLLLLGLRLGPDAQGVGYEGCSTRSQWFDCDEMRVERRQGSCHVCPGRIRVIVGRQVETLRVNFLHASRRR